jgi:hypothetical protein
MRRGQIFAALCALVFVACGDDDDSTDVPEDMGAGTDASAEVDMGPPPPFVPDSYCPGGDGCPSGNDGTLMVGAAMRDITPVIDDNTDTMTVDVNGNALYDPGEDEYDDANGNGIFDPVYIAGFGSPRPASGMHDSQWARAVVMRNGDVTIAMVALDTFSIFFDDVAAMREMVADTEVDYLTACASHSHQAADTLGIYGPDTSTSGVDPAYLDRVRAEAAGAVRDALENMQAANVQYATFRFRDQPGGMLRYVSDNRHPHIIDDEARIVRFTEAGTETTIATLVNFGSHAEYWGSRNSLLSSDFVHWMREGIEGGVTGPDGEVPGVGGVALFFEGAIGSQIGPQQIEPETWEGTAIETDSMEAAEVVGEQMAYFVLEALGDGGGSVTDMSAELGFRHRSFFVDVENRGFHIAFLGGLFIRESYNWDPDRVLRPGINEPDVLTEVAVVDIGRLQLQLIPGEIDPSLFIGGYDGSHTPEGVEIVDETEENAPDLSMAPEGPYLRDLARSDAEFVGILSLANDEIGYLLPDFDYVLFDGVGAYLIEAEGQHYEETNSIGINGWSRVKAQIEQLLAWVPEGD